MVGTHAGDMIGEIALAIEMGADAVDIGKTMSLAGGTGSLKKAKRVLHGSLTKWRHGLMIRLAKKLPNNSQVWHLRNTRLRLRFVSS